MYVVFANIDVIQKGVDPAQESTCVVLPLSIHADRLTQASRQEDNKDKRNLLKSPWCSKIAPYNKHLERDARSRNFILSNKEALDDSCSLFGNYQRSQCTSAPLKTVCGLLIAFRRYNGNIVSCGC